VFLVPDKYLVNYINIVLPAGATANIDTLDIAPILFSPIAGTTWTVARMPIAAGPHHLTTSQKSGLTVYGYDKDVSYGYPGGAGLSGTP
jgi:hypothetical protein